MLSQFVIMFANRSGTKLLIVLSGFCVLGLASAEEISLDRQQTQALIERFLKCWETGDRQTFAAVLHADVEFAYPGDRIGKTELLALFDNYQREKREIRIYFWDQFFVDGDKFAFAYQFAATDRSTGKRQAVGTGVVGRIKDGKIIQFKEYYDEQVAELQYQGKLPLDEGQVTPWPASVWLRPETID